MLYLRCSLPFAPWLIVVVLQGWDRVAQEMKTDRTPKQLQEHWLERQKECIALLQEMGPAPR